MPLAGTESSLADALHTAATATSGDAKEAWNKVAEIIISHITSNTLVTGMAPNGPLTNGKVT